ncbi:MAG TPA: hypothetical protein VFQ82_05200, partial [Stellaceae bacterium]|nr:hypothetical protein [Stellaceae bacterium]
ACWAHVRRKFFDVDAADRVPALGAIPVLRRYADSVSEIPEHRFRRDISSSEIRARNSSPARRIISDERKDRRAGGAPSARLRAALCHSGVRKSGWSNRCPQSAPTAWTRIFIRGRR